ncbi:MAG: peptidoglycan-binding protein [Actinomycetota bacterium]
MTDSHVIRLSRTDLDGEVGSALPPKEVLSLLDVNLDLDLALDLAAPIDLAVAANANVVAPIDAAVAGNILSALSEATALADQDATIEQTLSGEAIADAPQTSVIDQGADAVQPEDPEAGALELPTDPTAALDSGLLNLDVDLALDADLAAPVAGAVALNANVAAPIDAAVAANIGSIGSTAVAVADQDVVISQTLDEVIAEATADQDSTISQ